MLRPPRGFPASLAAHLSNKMDERPGSLWTSCEALGVNVLTPGATTTRRGAILVLNMHVGE